MLFQELGKFKRSSIMTSIIWIAVGVLMIICPAQYVNSLVELMGYGLVIFAGVMILDFISSKHVLMNYIYLTCALVSLCFLEGGPAPESGGWGVALGLGAMTSLRCMERGNLLVLAPLVVTMLGDSGAYFAGRGLGKRKMSPRTSPNKTVAGLVGGLLASALGMVIYGLVLRAFGLSGSLWKLAVVGLVAGVAEQLGDLSFSLIKRHAGAKDYGNLLPGHGGAYDRFDSASFAAPTVLVLLKLLEVF